MKNSFIDAHFQAVKNIETDARGVLQLIMFMLWGVFLIVLAIVFAVFFNPGLVLVRVLIILLVLQTPLSYSILKKYNGSDS